MIRISVKALVIALMIELVSISSFAGELQLHLGGLQADSPSERTYSWALEYRHPFTDNLSASFTWLNEGHILDHHRDGQAAQVWWRTAPLNHGLRFEAGLGPYYYSDTVTASNTDGYANVHGWGMLGSIGATWDWGPNWLGSLRLNRVQTRNSVNTTSLVAGVGYRFGPIENRSSGFQTTVNEANFKRMEFDAMLGETVLNSFTSDMGFAKALAVRMRANKNVTLSLAYLDEGNLDRDTIRLGRRAGVAPQIWLENDLTERFSVGVGIGPYFATQKPRPSEGNSASTVSALISATAAYEITPAWTGRLVWNRVSTSYGRDTDVVTVGLGYRF